MDARPIYAALFERMKADLGSAVVSFTRQNLPANAFPEEKQPALVVLATTNEIEGGIRTPTRYTLGATLVLHTRIKGDDPAPDDAIVELVDKIERALRWREGEARSEGMSYWTTLGGLVLWASLEDGSIQEDVFDAGQNSTELHVKLSALAPRG